MKLKIEAELELTQEGLFPGWTPVKGSEVINITTDGGVLHYGDGDRILMINLLTTKIISTELEKDTTYQGMSLENKKDRLEAIFDVPKTTLLADLELREGDKKAAINRLINDLLK